MSTLNHRSLMGRETRRFIRLTLGDSCALCGHRGELEFHVLPGFEEKHHDLSFPGRQSFYLRKMLMGGLQLLCAACHRSTTDRIRKEKAAVAWQRPPFPIAR
jgi:hypothetical protein